MILFSKLCLARIIDKTQKKKSDWKKCQFTVKKKKKKKKNKPEVTAIKFNFNIHKPCYNLKALDVGFKPVFRSVLSLFFFFSFFFFFFYFFL